MTFLNRGSIHLGSYRGVPIRVHWTTPLGAFVFSGARFAPGAWLGFALLIVIHELGHAALARRYGVRVRGIDVYGLGGECRLSGGATKRQYQIIAWGGVLAQAVLFVAAIAALRPLSNTPFTSELAESFVGTNLWLICFNLLPIAPLDGASAWRVFERPSWGREDLSEGPQRANPAPPKRDWFARARERSQQMRSAPRPRRPGDVFDDASPLSPENAATVDRFLAQSKRK
jgi:stage IV sporulation protein FB